ncbi:uracil-DNA glycosylase [Pigmentiphaga aceris]|uniref:Type-4 uracil-DNA glycosylase n=1 Tax=Pigmentiphaga aceris TaxID=1940612 RepID=A0A5C0AUZ4_9BURK|nr:uracil-DNA glycosylase [Pigmentiphaga aceris]QEI06252.1 uracil-DNA glycosylase [Pigmentiphaga aceris]
MSVAPDVSSPLRRAWLRELGIERVWAATPPAQVASQAPQVSAQALAEAPAETASPAAASVVAPPARMESPAAAARPAEGGARATTPRTTTGRMGPAQVHRDALASMVAAPKANAAPPVTQAQAIEWASGDPEAAWAALQAEVSVCTKCALSKGRTQSVFGSGPRSAQWLLIGEAPGEQEDRQGVPFVGRSGQLLENMLGAIGVQRAKGDAFVTNIVKCRPPNNRNPEPEEAAACRPYLERQVALLNPQRALAVGRVAAQNVLGTDATIGSLRGRVHRLGLGGKDIPMVVSYHPAYLLRAPLEKIKAWHDLKLVSGIGEPQ